VTSPNEAGAPNRGDNPNGDGWVDRSGAHRAATGPGRIPDAGDSPPWQRGGARPAQQPQRQAADPPTDVRTPSSIDARLNRFISGTSTPAAGPPGPPAPPAPPAKQEHEALPPRSENPPAEAYASELPDLSGPMPRTAAPRKTETATASGAGRTATAEAREGREGRVQVSSRRARGPVRASMQIRRIDPWSTLKVSLLLSVALFFVWMIAVAFLYLVLGGMGVWSKLNSNVGDLLNNTSGSSGELVSSGTIFGGAVLIGLVNIVLMTAMATIAAFVYNLTTDLIGGIEVTLADRD